MINGNKRMFNIKGELLVNLILFGQLILSYILFDAPNLVFYSVSVFTSIFLAYLYVFSQTTISSVTIKSRSEKISSRLKKPIIVGVVFCLLIKVVADSVSSPTLGFIAFLIFVIILIVLSFVSPVIDAVLVWSFLKRSST